MSLPVFIPAVLLIVGALIFATWWGATEGEEAFETLNANIVEGVGWWYVLLTAVFIAFALWAGFSRAGNIRLGRDDEAPEFGLGSWFCMLFAAGMGIGLVFWGVSEPLFNLMGPPEFADPDGDAGEAVGQALVHWGLHAWAIYVIVGLGLAYMTFRRGRPLSIRWLLEPIFGRKLIQSWVGHVIDIVAIVGTVFGVVTSLGIGVQQIATGLDFMGWANADNEFLLTWLIVGIMAIATFSVITGVHKGLKWLSNINMVMAAGLALFVLLAGPTLFLLQSMVGNLGEYLQTFPQMIFETNAAYHDPEAESTFSGDWTIYYWGWWMSWAPFVGMFIARISRGRTVREFVFGVLLAPTMISVIWFSIFGSSGIFYYLRDEANMQNDEGTLDEAEGLYLLFQNLPVAEIAVSLAAVFGILVITIFFITSGDSGSLVTDVLAYGGRTETPRLTRVFWTLLIAVTAIVLLAAAPEPDASLRVLQVASISAAAPLSIVFALAVVAMVRLLAYDGKNTPRYVRVRRHASKAALVDTARAEAGSDEGPAVQRTLLQMLNEQTKVLRGMFGNTSATLAGLPITAGKGSASGKDNGNDDLVLAIQDIPAHATKVNAETGVLGWDKKAAYRDPIDGDASFETPEYSASYTGWEHEAEEYFHETVATGTIPVVDPDEDEEKK
ncbi:BCCT family transporter [Nesterenkonia sp. MY13]|uniref:BCCT family transporter n=1 Tax=Nesterenkonia sedimenti TaxID=1463632 RepID=A0A7X8YDB8_9MICC|nr:BCCT family transporter [Nesterenkonia sedimenti]